MKSLSVEEWRRVEQSLRELFVADGYRHEASVDLAYILVQSLQNAEGLFLMLPILLKSEDRTFKKEEKEGLFSSIHMIFGDHKQLIDGERLIMREA